VLPDAGNTGVASGVHRLICLDRNETAMRLAPVVTLAATVLALAGCGTTLEQRAATGAVAGAVVAGPVGAAVGGAAGAAVGQAVKDD
jgi:hypothetical protein